MQFRTVYITITMIILMILVNYQCQKIPIGKCLKSNLSSAELKEQSNNSNQKLNQENIKKLAHKSVNDNTKIEKDCDTYPLHDAINDYNVERVYDLLLHQNYLNVYDKDRLSILYYAVNLMVYSSDQEDKKLQIVRLLGYHILGIGTSPKQLVILTIEKQLRALLCDDCCKIIIEYIFESEIEDLISLNYLKNLLLQDTTGKFIAENIGKRYSISKKV